MLDELLSFDMPGLYNPHDRSEILCNLEALAISAFCLSGGGQAVARNFTELEFEPDLVLDDPEIVYASSYNELIEIIDGYNFFISENKLPEPLIQLVIDDEKTSLLKEDSLYPIYMLVLCNEQDYLLATSNQ